MLMVVQESALYRRFLNRWTNTFDIWGRGLRRGPLVASLQPDTETQSTLSSPSITLTDTQDTVATNCLDPSHNFPTKMMMTFPPLHTARRQCNVSGFPEW